jgi:hypothetical protein
MAQAWPLKSGRLGGSSNNHTFSIEKAVGVSRETPGDIDYLLIYSELNSLLRAIENTRPALKRLRKK